MATQLKSSKPLVLYVPTGVVMSVDTGAGESLVQLEAKIKEAKARNRAEEESFFMFVRVLGLFEQESRIGEERLEWRLYLCRVINEILYCPGSSNSPFSFNFFKNSISENTLGEPGSPLILPSLKV